MRKPRKIPGARVPVAKAAKVDQAVLPHFWHPDRPQFTKPPVAFLNKLEAIHPAFAVAWNPERHRWVLWAKNTRITYKLCPGWQLVLVWESAEGNYRPLDERLLALAADRCARHVGDGKRYIERVIGEMERDKRKAEEQIADERNQWCRDRVEYWKPKNVGSGSKFSTYHA